MFKTETHLHTKPVSFCGRLTPGEMVELYRRAGYSTVFITNHLDPYHFRLQGEGLTWRQNLDLFYGAYLEAKAAGDACGLHVLFSAELTLRGNHFLLYGMDENFFFALRPGVFEMTVEEFRHRARANGIAMVQAHPLRDGLCTPYPQWVDGLEAVNSNPRHENFDDEVFALAQEYHLAVSAGSDAHRQEDIAGAAMLSDRVITGSREYAELLLGGKLRLMKQGAAL